MTKKLKYGMLFEEFVESLNEEEANESKESKTLSPEAQKIWDEIVKLEPRLKNCKWKYEKSSDYPFTCRAPLSAEGWHWWFLHNDKTGFAFIGKLDEGWIDDYSWGPTKNPKKFLELIKTAIKEHNATVKENDSDDVISWDK